MSKWGKSALYGAATLTLAGLVAKGISCKYEDNKFREKVKAIFVLDTDTSYTNGYNWKIRSGEQVMVDYDYWKDTVEISVFNNEQKKLHVYREWDPTGMFFQDWPTHMFTCDAQFKDGKIEQSACEEQNSRSEIVQESFRSIINDLYENSAKPIIDERKRKDQELMRKRVYTPVEKNIQ